MQLKDISNNQNHSPSILNTKQEIHTSEYSLGEKTALWTKQRVIIYCFDTLSESVKSFNIEHKLIILYKFLPICDCNDKIEFEEEIIEPILNRFCINQKLDFDAIKSRIHIQYKENF